MSIKTFHLTLTAPTPLSRALTTLRSEETAEHVKRNGKSEPPWQIWDESVER